MMLLPVSDSVDINKKKNEKLMDNDALYYGKCFLNRCVFTCFFKSAYVINTT